MLIRKLALGLSLGALLGGAALLVACPASLDARCDEGACGPAVTSNESGAGEAGSAIPTDDCFTTPTSAQCLGDATALFVSPTGNDQSPGTRSQPFLTLAGALSKIDAQHPRIYICTGTYPEDVTLSAIKDITIFGGFRCDNWQAEESQPTFGASPTALRITDSSGVGIANVTFRATDATAPGGSSIGALVVRSALTFRGVGFRAGNGRAGDGGVTTNYVLDAAAPGSADGSRVVVVCPGGQETAGGAGGIGGRAGESGTPNGGDGGALAVACSSAGANGFDGTQPATPTAGASAASVGALVPDGWIPGSGTRGADGPPGGGGGGGAGIGGQGSGGGAGGCGGAGGGAGSGGGASIAVASYNSSVVLTDCTLTASSAGNGGRGAAGQAGVSPGGKKGASLDGCGGGVGGSGATGATGGSGAGGISVGIAYTQSPPMIDEPTRRRIIVGDAGAAGSTGGQSGLSDLFYPPIP